MFDEVGYHQCSIDNITTYAGCSRVSFYQYFSSKEDVFRRLAARVARQLNASTDRLDPLTPDAAGWIALREWVARFAEIYARYSAVFRSFPKAAESDTTLVGDSVRTASRYISGIRSRVVSSSLTARHIDAVMELLREALAQTLDDALVLHTAVNHAFSDDAILDAYTDVVHRTLFGLLADVNVHRHRAARFPKLPFGPIMRAAFDEEAVAKTDGSAAGARAALLEAGREVFVSRGYHATRIDDIVDGAGVSHGAFYRYFKGKDELAHLLASQAMRSVAAVFTEVPDPVELGPKGTAALKRWLRRYNDVQVSETGMIRVWVDASLEDESLLADSASVLDWGRRRMGHFLRQREFGDAGTDAVVLLAFIDTFGVSERSTRAVDAAALVIERGFLGR